jgi:hypothetical protein
MRSKKRLVVVFDHQDSLHSFAAAELIRSLEATGFTVSAEKSILEAVDSIILCEQSAQEAQNVLCFPGIAALPSAAPQGYSVRKKILKGVSQTYVMGADGAGTLYGALDVARTIQLHGLKAVTDTDKKPFIAKRGIKFNIPLDARTPSYSDSGDSAQGNMAHVWEITFWHEFLDEMARNRFNVLSLWSLHPFPSLVKVPEYPRVALDDVKQNTIFVRATSRGNAASTAQSRATLKTLKRMAMDEKIAFWRNVMQYARVRGIEIYLFTWNTFVYGTEDSGYGFTTELSDLKTQDYFRQSVKATLKTYPLLAGIGITAGENMSRDAEQDETWLYNTYGQGINDALATEPQRRFRLIHRGHWADLQGVRTAFANLHPHCSLEWSYKYSRAHMYASVKPPYIDVDGYLTALGNDKTWLTVRDDSFYLFRWADADFARGYLQNMPLERLEGFYMGPDGLVWGRETSSVDPDSPRQLIFKRRWLCFSMWGNLAYDPQIPNSDFVGLVASRFPKIDAAQLCDAWAYASKIIPLVNRFHSLKSSSDYQWYPEGCTSNQGFHDVNRFIDDRPQHGQGLMSIPEYADTILGRKRFTGTTPLQVAQDLSTFAYEALLRTFNFKNVQGKELRQTIGDIECMALLGHYYAKKIAGATYKHLVDETADSDVKQQYRTAAIAEFEAASLWWKLYSNRVSGLYLPQTLNRITSEKERQTDVLKLQKDVDADIVLAGETLPRE